MCVFVQGTYGMTCLKISKTRMFARETACVYLCLDDKRPDINDENGKKKKKKEEGQQNPILSTMNGTGRE